LEPRLHEALQAAGRGQQLNASPKIQAGVRYNLLLGAILRQRLRTTRKRLASQKFVHLLAVGVFAIGLTACFDGSDGSRGKKGDPAPPPGVDIGDATEINAEITGVTIASPPVVDFTLTDGGGNAVRGLPASSISFTIAKLIPGTDGNASAWQSYINVIEQPGAGPGTDPEVQASSESGSAGALVENEDGSYRYTFSFDIDSVTDPIAVSYQPNLTHRVSFQIREFVPVDNPVFDYRPSGNAQSGIFSREIVKTENCNACHEKLAYHGGRFTVGRPYHRRSHVANPLPGHGGWYRTQGPAHAGLFKYQP